MTKQSEPIVEIKKPLETKKPKASHRFQREKDSRMVKGRFIYTELPGGVLQFNYLVHKGDKPKKYNMIDGQIYTVPLAVARHLNKNVAYPEYTYAEGGDMIDSSHLEEGKMMRIKRMVRRCSFEPLDFIADEELQGVQSDIIHVETV